VQKKTLTLLSIAVAIILAGVFSIAIAANNTDGMANCAAKGAAHTVSIRHSKLSTVQAAAQRCDTLTIRNLDPERSVSANMTTIRLTTESASEYYAKARASPLPCVLAANTTSTTTFTMK
jgi:hypothetical protein